MPIFSRYGVCEICKKEGQICEHHILKKIVFGDSKKTRHICEECHRRIDASVKAFETEILNKFSDINILIWELYLKNNDAPLELIREKVEIRFKTIQERSFRIRRKPSFGRKTKKEDLTDEQFTFLEEKQCPICGRKRNLTIHHIKKWIIFKDNRMLGFPCRKCHNRIESSVTMFEAEVLKHFGASYRYIWNVYCKKGYMSDIMIRRLAKSQFIQVQKKLYGKNIKRQEGVIRKIIARKKDQQNGIIIKERSILA